MLSIFYTRWKWIFPREFCNDHVRFYNKLAKYKLVDEAKPPLGQGTAIGVQKVPAEFLRGGPQKTPVGEQICFRRSIGHYSLAAIGSISIELACGSCDIFFVSSSCVWRSKFSHQIELAFGSSQVWTVGHGNCDQTIYISRNPCIRKNQSRRAEGDAMMMMTWWWWWLWWWWRGSSLCGWHRL